MVTLRPSHGTGEVAVPMRPADRGSLVPVRRQAPETRLSFMCLSLGCGAPPYEARAGRRRITEVQECRARSVAAGEAGIRVSEC